MESLSNELSNSDMKDITLRIVGNKLVGLDETAGDDPMEFVTQGRFVKKGDAAYLLYEESELSGMEGCTTSLKITGNKVRMRRYGEETGFDSAVEFEKGKKWGGLYETPFGPVPMEALTNYVGNNLDIENGTGSLIIDCSVSLKGLAESRNLLKFEILQ